MTQTLNAVSYLSPNLFTFYQAISDAFCRALHIDVKANLTQSSFDPMDDPALRTGEADIVFLCGLPYTLIARKYGDQMAILGAPVAQSARYGDRPVYFSDVIVRASSGVERFQDLAGSTLCYNNLTSNSGYNVLRAWMIEKGLTAGFFGNVVESGSHQQSIQCVVDGRADCSAIDSIVLEQEIRLRPELAAEIRVCTTIGPTPMPPIIATSRLGERAIDQMRAVLQNPDSELQAAMRQASVRRFAAMNPDDYAVLGVMWDRAEKMGFPVIR
jgi:phosphonate transport system substrate-binding protein